MKILKKLLWYSTTSPIYEPRRLPNVGYLGVGYDIYRGNPREIGNIDPGFRLEPIFNLTLDGDTTPDSKYILPMELLLISVFLALLTFLLIMFSTLMITKKN